jgi:hypothetical protein
LFIISHTLKIYSKINLDIKEAEKRGVAREQKIEGLTSILLIKRTDAGVPEEHLSNTGVNLSH